VCDIYIIYIYLLYIEQETSQRTVQLELEHGSFGDLSPTVCPFDLETCVGKKWTQSLLSSHPIWGSYPFLSCSQKLIPPVNKSFLRYRNHVWRNSTIMSSWLCIYIYASVISIISLWFASVCMLNFIKLWGLMGVDRAAAAAWPGLRPPLMRLRWSLGWSSHQVPSRNKEISPTNIGLCHYALDIWNNGTLY
jgi:hypothetical protein